MDSEIWKVVDVDHHHTRLMLDLKDPSAPYYEIKYIDLVVDDTEVFFVKPSLLATHVERVLLDRITKYGGGPKWDHEKAIREDIARRDLPELDVDVSGLF